MLVKEATSLVGQVEDLEDSPSSLKLLLRVWKLALRA
jgi:hypothetical protein